MRIHWLFPLLSAATLLGGCTTTDEIIIDRKGVDMARYAVDKAECEAYADEVRSGEKAVRGAASGAVVGGAIGGIVGDSSEAAARGARPSYRMAGHGGVQHRMSMRSAGAFARSLEPATSVIYGRARSTARYSPPSGHTQHPRHSGPHCRGQSRSGRSVGRSPRRETRTSGYVTFARHRIGLNLNSRNPPPPDK